MGWFDRKKDEKPKGAKPKSEETAFAESLQSTIVQEQLQRHEAILHKNLPGSEKLMPLLQAMLLTPQARLAYGKQIVALYEHQAGRSFVAPKRGEKDRELMLESPGEVVEQILKHLRVLDQFPVGEPTSDKAPEQNNEYFDQFDQMMGFLMKRLDRSQPMVDQVSRLMDAVNLDHVGSAIIEAVKDKDKTVMRGKLKDRVVKYLVAMNKM